MLPLEKMALTWDKWFISMWLPVMQIERAMTWGSKHQELASPIGQKTSGRN